jgi:hypothetical protein
MRECPPIKLGVQRAGFHGEWLGMPSDAAPGTRA